MSEWDEIDNEAQELLENPDELTPEDVFKMVMVNRIKKTQVKVELRDSEGDKVDLTEVIKDLLSYMKDKIQDENGSQLSDQILPLISQSVVSCLGRLIGIPATAFYLANDTTKDAILWSMCMAFLLLKYVQKHNLTINTHEEAVSDEEIEGIERRSEANKIATIGTLLGENPREVLDQMIKEGKLKQEDLVDLLGQVRKKDNAGNSGNDKN